MNELACPVCGIAWTRHLGMIGTCDRVKRLEDQRDKMEKAIRDALTFDCLTVYVRNILRNSLPEEKNDE